MRTRFLRPFFRNLDQRLAAGYDISLTHVPIPDGIVGDQAARLLRQHKRNALRKLGRALSLDAGTVAGILGDDAQGIAFMNAWHDQNVNLITTMGHESLGRLRDAGVQNIGDRQAWRRLLSKEVVRSKKHARLIARDQTSKAIGQLTRVRHEQAGLTHYIWRTSGDERVRPSHSDLDGTVQEWQKPPGIGHPGDDIQCRCVAEPVLPQDVPGVAQPAVAKEPLAVHVPERAGEDQIAKLQPKSAKNPAVLVRRQAAVRAGISTVPRKWAENIDSIRWDSKQKGVAGYVWPYQPRAIHMQQVLTETDDYLAHAIVHEATHTADLQGIINPKLTARLADLLADHRKASGTTVIDNSYKSAINAYEKLPATNRPVTAYALTSEREYVAETLAYALRSPKTLATLARDGPAGVPCRRGAGILTWL